MRTSLIRLRRAGVLVLTCLCFSAAHSQQPSQATLEAHAARALATLAQDDAALDQSISIIYGKEIAPEKRAVVKTQLRWFIRDERVVAYLLRLMLPVTSPTLTSKDAQALVVEGMASLKARGLRRLPTERKAQVVQLSLGMFTAVPVGVCKAMALGKLDTQTMHLIEARYNASLSLRSFEAMVALVQDAVEAELAEFPDMKTLNSTQAQGADRAHTLALQSRAERLPAGLLDRTQDLETADPYEACLLVRESLAAGLDLAEPYRGWWLSRLIEGL